MMGNFLSFIWDKLNSLLNLFANREGDASNDSLTTTAKNKLNNTRHQKQSSRGISGQSHEKTIKEVAKSEYVHLVERLATRYDLTENAKAQMLRIFDEDVQCGEYSLQDQKYSVTVVKRDADFDLKLFRACITEHVNEGVVFE